MFLIHPLIKGWGPVTGLDVWDREYKEPIHLITSFRQAELAVAYYKKRLRIETFFSDSGQKSRGFLLRKSNLNFPVQLSRLLIDCVYAYRWLNYLGVYARENDWDKIVQGIY